MKARELRKKKNALFPGEGKGARQGGFRRESSFMRSTAPRLESSSPRANLNYYPGYYDVTVAPERPPALDDQLVSQIRESTFKLSESAAIARLERSAQTRTDLRSRERHRKSEARLQQRSRQRRRLRSHAEEETTKLRAARPPHRVCPWYPRPELKLKPQ